MNLLLFEGSFLAGLLSLTLGSGFGNAGDFARV